MQSQHHGPGPHRKGRASGDIAFLSHPAHGQAHNNRIEIEFGAGPEAAAAARNALLALGDQLDESLLGDVRLLVSELVTNSVRHSGVDHTHRIQLRAEHAGRKVRVEVSDAGEGFEPVPRDLDRTRPGGWGLYLVDQLADRWGVEHDGLTLVWFEIDRRNGRRSSEAAA
jgi:anti-sigma regulatory factor (Ser/Thr protein kinase)